MSKKYFLELTDCEKARDIVFNTLRELLTPDVVGTEIIPVERSLNRISAEPIRAFLPVPREYLSAMDGVATRAEYTHMASPTNPVKISKGVYVPINTGNVIPEGYDCVIRREDYWEEGDGIVVRTPHQRYQNVRVPGEDVLPFDLILEPFKLITGKVVALAIQSGIREVEVLKPLKAVFIPTGSELLKPGEEYVRSKVYETNSYLVEELLRSLHLEYTIHEIVLDEPSLIKEAIEKSSSQNHLIFLSGGTSAGEYDYTAEILKEEGTLLIHGLNLRPGKPFVFGIYRNRPIFGIPGYPGAGLFVMEYILLPVLKAFLGITEGGGTLDARAGRKLSATGGNDHLFNVVVSKVKENFWFYPIKQGSGPLSPFIQRSGYVVVEKGMEGVDEGDRREVFLSIEKSFVDSSLLFVGSHDLTLDILKELLWNKYRWLLNVVNVGSLGGMVATAKDQAHFSGVHLMDEETGEYNVVFLKRMNLKNVALFPFLKREQGFVLRKDLEGKVKSFKDVVELGLTFVSRQRGSGTRILTDYLLKKEGINPANVKGYGNDLISHLEVAHYVKVGTADVGVAIYPVAKLLDLAFIPIAEEEYDLLVLKDFIKDPRFKKLVEEIMCSEFRRRVEELGGYKIVFSEVPKFEG